MNAAALDLSAIHFGADQLIPVVAQAADDHAVLLLAFMNAEALRLTWRTGEAHFWSRSRQTLWRKGETSGRRLLVEGLAVNCEGNSLLLTVRLDGDAACHEGYRSCYYRAFDARGQLAITAPRLFAPAEVYGAPPDPAPIVTSVSSGSQSAQPPDDAAPATPPGDVAPSPAQTAAGVEDVGGADDASNLDGADIVADLRALYACYLRLRDEDFTAVSATARLLHNPSTEAAWLLGRAYEELAELRGVVAGSHRHTGGQADVILEASQSLYWLALFAARSQLAYDEWRPHLALAAGWASQRAPTAPHATDAPADQIATPPIAPLQRILWELGVTLRAANTPLSAPIAADLASLRQRLAEPPRDG